MWMLIEPMPLRRPERSRGPRQVDDWLCLPGVLYVLCNGIARQTATAGAAVRLRTDLLTAPGPVAAVEVFDQLHRILIAQLNAVGELDWSRACVDNFHIRATRGEPMPARHRSTGGRRAANAT